MIPHRHPGPYIGKLRILHRLSLLVLGLAAAVAIAFAAPAESASFPVLRTTLLIAAAVAGGRAFLRRGGKPWHYAGIPLLAVIAPFIDRAWLALAAAALLVLITLAGGSASRGRPGWRELAEGHPPLPYLAQAAVTALALRIFGTDGGSSFVTWIRAVVELALVAALLFGALAMWKPRPRRAPRSDSSSSAIPAIVSSAASPAAVTIVQSLGPRGIPIHALSNLDHPACLYSRWVTSCHITESGRGGGPRHDNVQEPDSLLDYLDRHVERGVLFPGTDANIRFLARHKRRLEELGFRMCIPDADVLANAADKSDLAAFCARHGFPAPRTVVVDSAADLTRVRELAFPIVLKGVFMKNHRLVERREQLESAYASFLERFRGKSDDPRAVAQEWIPGPPSRFAKLYVVCDPSGQVIAHHTLRRVRVQIRRDGSQGDTLIAKTEAVPELVERWLPFFRTLGWVGVASMECKYDERDGEYKIVEINPRPWAILKISVDCGVDVPLLYYQLACGERLEPRQGFVENRYYIRLLWGNIDPPEPWRVLGMLVTRRISLGEVLGVYWTLLRNWRRVTIDVGRLSDPWPTIACLYYYGVRYFTRWF